ncbi:MAG: DapH/DapD/GlmU-related protein [Candidatus Limiplasma sp.]|nr:DapH/DapD/GlmU-related protein [Candidatus Limiplasma sp.]
MKRTLGILLAVDRPEWLNRPLLGKPSRQYVEQALTDAGIAAIAPALTQGDALHDLLAEDVALAVLAQENAPCLNAETYRALAAAAAERPAAVLLEDMQTPLALAVPASLLRELPLKGSPTLTGLIDLLNARSIAVKVVHAQSPDAYLAITDAASFAAAFAWLRAAQVRLHQQNGVLLLEPERTVIEADVRIGAGTVVYGGNVLQNGTVIGANCTLYPNNRLDHAVLGDAVTVENSVLLHCRVGAHTTVGPFAYLRPDAAIGEHCRIGDFVEVKNSSIGDGTKVSHLTYVGDSDLGRDINLGCGVVFVNYDGKVKSRSRVDDHAFIGCNCNLVAPVHIGENAYLAAGSTVVEDVPADALFVARSRGVIKEDWVKRRKEQGKL